MCCRFVMRRLSIMIYILFYTSQNHILLLFLCSLDCKWNLLSARFNIFFTLLTIILVNCCEMCVGQFMVLFNKPFSLQITSWTMLLLNSIRLLKCFCSIVKLLNFCSHVFANVSENITTE